MDMAKKAAPANKTDPGTGVDRSATDRCGDPLPEVLVSSGKSCSQVLASESSDVVTFLAASEEKLTEGKGDDQSLALAPPSGVTCSSVGFLWGFSCGGC